jgi:hypothetical protein
MNSDLYDKVIERSQLQQPLRIKIAKGCDKLETAIKFHIAFCKRTAMSGLKLQLCHQHRKVLSIPQLKKVREKCNICMRDRVNRSSLHRKGTEK